MADCFAGLGQKDGGQKKKERGVMMCDELDLMFGDGKNIRQSVCICVS